MKSGGTVRCFFDVSIDDVPSGRIMFELFNHLCPKTCENFRALCTGEAGLGKVTNKPLHYEGVKFHRIIKDFMVQAGDFSAGNGTGGESIYGGCFDDENFDIPHNTPFLLSMANRGKNTNGSQFFITTQPAHHLDGKHVVFGRVVSGQDVLVALEELPVDNRHRPLNSVAIARCGELLSRAKGKDKKKSKKKVVTESESDSEEEVKKKKKKKKDKKKKKKSKKSKKAKHQSSESDGSEEEGEVVEDDDDDEIDPRFEQHHQQRSNPLKRPHPSSAGAMMVQQTAGVFRTNPLVQVSHINPDEIPDVPKNRFLFRGAPAADRDDPKELSGRVMMTVENGARPRDRRGARDPREHVREYDDRSRAREREPYGARKKVKGRGAVRYLPPAARSRTPTPPHWRQEQRRTVPLEIHQRRTERLMEREAELEERKMKREERHRQAALKSRKQLQGGEEPMLSDDGEEDEEGEEVLPPPKKSRKKEQDGQEWVRREEEEEWTTVGKKRANLDGDWRKARKETREGREDDETNGREEEQNRKKRRSSARGERREGERKESVSDKKAEKTKEKGAFEHNSDDSEDDLKEEDPTMGDLNKILDYGDDNVLDYDPIEEDEKEDEEEDHSRAVSEDMPGKDKDNEKDCYRLENKRGRQDGASKGHANVSKSRSGKGKKNASSSDDDAGDSDSSKEEQPSPLHEKYVDGDAEMEQEGSAKRPGKSESKAKESSDDDEPPKKEPCENSKKSKTVDDVSEKKDEGKVSVSPGQVKEKHHAEIESSSRRRSGSGKGDSSDKKGSERVDKITNGSKKDESVNEDKASAKSPEKETARSPVKAPRSSGDRKTSGTREDRAPSRDKGGRGSRDRSDKDKRDKDPKKETSGVPLSGSAKGEASRSKDVGSSRRRGDDLNSSRRRSRSRSRDRGTNKRRSRSRSRRRKSRSRSRGRRSRTPDKLTRGRRSRSRSEDKSRSRRRRSRSRTPDRSRGGRKVSRSRSRGRSSRSNDRSRRQRSRSHRRRSRSHGTSDKLSRSRPDRGGRRSRERSSSSSSSSSSSAASSNKKSSSDSD